MKAIVINKQDQSLSYTDVPNPVLKAGEVLIETYAAALNRADLLQKQGTYPSPAGRPSWPGLELSGKIADMGKRRKKRAVLKSGTAFAPSWGAVRMRKKLLCHTNF